MLNTVVVEEENQNKESCRSCKELQGYDFHNSHLINNQQLYMRKMQMCIKKI